MALKVTVVLLMAVVATLAEPPPTYGHHPTHSPYKQPGMPHNFAYNVKDGYSGTNFGHSENSDGNTVRGSYNVDLPDGRKQTVKYEADHHKGFTANVEYYGEAQYAHQSGPAVTFKPQPSYHQPSYPTQPSYQPQPSYPPQPSYQP